MTPYNAQAGRRIAEPWRRVVARLADWFIQGAATWFVMSVVYTVLLEAQAARAGTPGVPYQELGEAFIVLLAAGVVVAFGYGAATVALWGATPGKALMGLRVVRDDDTWSKVGWTRATLRWILPALPVPVLFLPVVGPAAFYLCSMVLSLGSVILLFADDWHRTIEDRFAGTLVVATR